MIIKKLTKHVRRWNLWRKYNMNHPVYQLLVLIGLRRSPTIPLILLPEEHIELDELFKKWGFELNDH